MLVLFNDILVYNTNLSDHVINLQVMFKVLLDNQLFAKKSNCSFAQIKVEYLGHIISGQGVSTDDAKIMVMLNWTQPKSIIELKFF